MTTPIPGSNPQSKFQIIGSYTALPGMCSSCGSSTGPAIDTGLSFDFYGVVVFCIACAQDLGRQAGLVDQGPDNAIVVDYDADVRHQVEEHLNGLTDAVTSLRNYFDNLPDPGVEPLSLLQEPGSGTGITDPVDAELPGPARKDSEPIVDKRSISVSSSSGSKLIFG